jgi:hypothetical protein
MPKEPLRIHLPSSLFEGHVKFSIATPFQGHDVPSLNAEELVLTHTHAVKTISIKQDEAGELFLELDD